MTSRDLWAGLDPPALISWIYELGKGTEHRLPVPSHWAQRDRWPRGAQFPLLAPAWQTQRGRQLGLRLHAASVLRKPPRCWLRDAWAGIMFYIHQCSCAGWPARSRALQGCPGERPRIPGEKGHVLQHHLAPEMGTTNCRIEENPLCSSSWSQTFPCVLQPLVRPQPWAPPCKFPSWSVHQVHLGIERGGRTMHQPLPTRACTTDKASKLIQHPTPWGE